MNTLIHDSDCVTAMRQLDLFLDNELDSAGAAQIRQHVQGCPSCELELEARKRLRGRLRSAVRSQMTPPHLGTRVLANVRAAEHASSGIGWRVQFAGVAAMLTLAVGLWVAYELGHLRVTVAQQNAYLGKISAKVAGIFAVGLKDHVHCAYFRSYPKTPPDPATFTSKLGPEWMPLVNVMRSSLPADYTVYLAHKCRFQGRQYVHLTLRSNSKLVSLVIAEKQAGETFRNSNLVPVASQAGVDLYGAGVQRFEITGFETDHHLAYLISDLSKKENVEVLAAASSGIHAVLKKIES